MQLPIPLLSVVVDTRRAGLFPAVVSLQYLLDEFTALYYNTKDTVSDLYVSLNNNKFCR